MKALALIAVLAIAATFNVGCVACQTALAEGTIVADGQSLVVQNASGDTIRIAWPAGYRVEGESGKRVLVDLLGGVKARQGDHVQVTGGLGTGDVFGACGPITVVAP